MLLNKALLCKRSWHFAVERKALWKRGKLCEGKLFVRSMGKKRADGGLDFGRTSDVETILCVFLFPSLFAISLAKEACTEDVWSHSGEGVWAPRFSRRLNDCEVFDVKRFS
ncbi:hypothetical protein CK203_034995 [Vitis vinifera]|uniref:Uncharacterized protein n=1 Tax=Vitis vinifera TaxID=29760 RepID=A0A438I9T7_VITVI|nr:hypothetical protein CK203_034995 [Vitis vinifera]